jgi:hypothetical protein
MPHCANSTTVQPRQPNQTIITEAISMIRNALASFRPIGIEVDREPIEECISTRWSRFIVVTAVRRATRDRSARYQTISLNEGDLSAFSVSGSPARTAGTNGARSLRPFVASFSQYSISFRATAARWRHVTSRTQN